MADQNITELPVKTSSGITSSDYMLGIDSAEGYQMLIRDLGDYIIRNVQVNTIAGANQTLKSALDTLNSKTQVANIPLNQSVTVSLGQDTLYLLVTAKPLGTDIASSLHIIYSSQYGSTLTEIYKRTNVTVSVDGLTLTMSADTQYVSYALITLK